MDQDFNNIESWLKPLLGARGMSVEQLANLCKLSRAAIYFYFDDTTRPKEQTMIKICQVLGVEPAVGLAQYTPKRPPLRSGRRSR